jgi:hypothetical protein
LTRDYYLFHVIPAFTGIFAEFARRLPPQVINAVFYVQGPRLDIVAMSIRPRLGPQGHR